MLTTNWQVVLTLNRGSAQYSSADVMARKRPPGFSSTSRTGDGFRRAKSGKPITRYSAFCVCIKWVLSYHADRLLAGVRCGTRHLAGVHR